MKKFILKIVTFIFPIIVLAYGADLYVSKNLKKSKKYAHSELPIWNDILNGELNADIIIHGSSRAWVHFDSQIIEDALQLSTYNLGIDGHTFNMQDLRHHLVLKYNKKPKMVIHSVDATTLQKGNFYNSEQILPYMLWDKDFQKFTSEYSTYSYLDYKLPMIRFFGETNAIYTALNVSFQFEGTNYKYQRINGYRGKKLTWNDDFDSAKKIMKRYEIIVDEDLKKRFDNYLKECKANDIEVLLVYAPVYIEGQMFIENEELLKDIYMTFAETYNFKFYDFTTDEICYNKTYFYNARHMNVKGAELFTKKLVSKIKTESINIAN